MNKNQEKLLKKIITESGTPGYENRKFGDSLPTLASVRQAYQDKNGITENEEETVEEAAPKMRKNKEAENLQKLLNLVANAQKGGMGSRYGKEFDKAKIKALRAMKDMVTYSNIGV